MQYDSGIIYIALLLFFFVVSLDFELEYVRFRDGELTCGN